MPHWRRPSDPAPEPRRPRPAQPARPAPRENVSAPSSMAGDPPLELPALEAGKAFALDAAAAARLLRREVNAKEAFTARDAAGAWWRASVKALDANGGEAVPYERMTRPPEPALELTLACAVLARQRMLFVAQKATELGVARIVPLLTEHSVPASGLEHEKAHAWPGQVLRAAKQCRRASLPALEAPMTLEAFLASPWSAADVALWLDDAGGEPPPAGVSPRSALLVVGPEGGFSDAERGRLAARARPWTLGGRVLRSESAVVAGLAAVQLLWGDFRS